MLMISEDNIQQTQKRHIKSSVENYLRQHQQIEPDLEGLLFEAKELLSMESTWGHRTYEKNGDFQLRTIDFDKDERSIVDRLYQDHVIPFLIKRITAIQEIDEKFRYIFLFGSYASYGKAQYTSDVDLRVCLRDDIPKEQFEQIRSQIYEIVQPVADALGFYVPTSIPFHPLIQVGYASGPWSLKYHKNHRVLYQKGSMEQ